MRSLKSKEK
jgi:hypothetical protein